MFVSEFLYNSETNINAVAGREQIVSEQTFHCHVMLRRIGYASVFVTFCSSVDFARLRQQRPRR